MKKFISFIFSIILIGAIGAWVYFNQEFTRVQINKVYGMYYVYKGDMAYKNGKMNKAIEYYNRGLMLYPGHYSAWYNLGNIYVAYEDYYSALDAYSQAIKYNPRMMIARMNYGIVATEKLGNFDVAIEQYNKIIETKRRLFYIPYVYDNKYSSKENKAIAYYNIGVTYRLKSLYSSDNWEKQRLYLSKAIEAYNKSLEIDDKRYDTLFNLALAYHSAGDYKNAGKNYCKAIEIDPMSFESHYNLAVLLRTMKHYKQAYEEIDKASTLVSALNENSTIQLYASIMMNDIMRNVYNNGNKIETKSSIKKEQNKNKNKKESKINLVKGRIVPEETSEKTTIKSFSGCPNMELFN